jgi:hypothetical protein
MIRFTVIVFVIALSLLTVSGVEAQANIRPAELQQMMSILKYIESKIEDDAKGLPQQIKLNTILESLELLGVDTGDRSRFKPGMSNSKISVLLLGEQLPEIRQVAVQNAISVLNLKADSPYMAEPDASNRPVPTYLNTQTISISNSSQERLNPATIKMGQKAQPITTKKTVKNQKTADKVKLNLDEIIFKAVGTATAQ